MTEITAGNESDTPPNFFDRRAYASAKTQMIFVRKKAITERDYFSIPAVALQEVERNRCAVIEIESFDSYRLKILFFSRRSNFVQQFFIKFSMSGCSWRAKVCEVAVELWPIVSDERGRFERRMG